MLIFDYCSSNSEGGCGRAAEEAPRMSLLLKDRAETSVAWSSDADSKEGLPWACSALLTQSNRSCCLGLWNKQQSPRFIRPSPIRGFKNLGQDLETDHRRGGSRVCMLSAQPGEWFWFSSKWISACDTKPPGINWKHWWPFSAEAEAGWETGNMLPLSPGYTGGGTCGRFLLTLPTLCVHCELSFPGLSRQSLSLQLQTCFIFLQ